MGEGESGKIKRTQTSNHNTTHLDHFILKLWATGGQQNYDDAQNQLLVSYKDVYSFWKRDVSKNKHCPFTKGSFTDGNQTRKNSQTKQNADTHTKQDKQN